MEAMLAADVGRFNGANQDLLWQGSGNISLANVLDDPRDLACQRGARLRG
jgi:hypothetical protein